MSITPSFFGGRRTNVFGPFSLDIWDPFHDFSNSISNIPAGARETSAFVNVQIDWKETLEAHVFKAHSIFVACPETWQWSLMDPDQVQPENLAINAGVFFAIAERLLRHNRCVARATLSTYVLIYTDTYSDIDSDSDIFRFRFRHIRMVQSIELHKYGDEQEQMQIHTDADSDGCRFRQMKIQTDADSDGQTTDLDREFKQRIQTANSDSIHQIQTNSSR
ncbi:17.8 kDa class I heat shock protein-like protein [Tanacetum coccineum]